MTEWLSITSTSKSTITRFPSARYFEKCHTSGSACAYVSVA
jgi:hypothetical protein